MEGGYTMDLYYVRLSLAEIKFELLSYGYQLATCDERERVNINKEMLAIIEKVDQLDEVLEKVSKGV